MRTDTATISPKPSKSNRAFSEKASVTNRVRSIDPRQQHPYEGRNSSAQGFEASRVSQ
jgi:hypothetical protein